MLILLVTAGIVVFVGVKKLDNWKIGGVGPDSVGSVEPAGDEDEAPRMEEPSNGVK